MLFVLSISFCKVSLGIVLFFIIIIFFHSIPLRCNHAALALSNASKEKEEAIVWLEEYPSFLFPIIQHKFSKIKSTIVSSQKKKKNIYIYALKAYTYISNVRDIY